MKRHHFVFHATWVAVTVSCLCFYLSESCAGEEEIVVYGKLTGYDAISVTVDGEKIDLCEAGQVLDPAEKPILTHGLVATETAKVTIINGCATEVQAMEIRR